MLNNDEHMWRTIKDPIPDMSDRPWATFQGEPETDPYDGSCAERMPLNQWYTEVKHFNWAAYVGLNEEGAKEVMDIEWRYCRVRDQHGTQYGDGWMERTGWEADVWAMVQAHPEWMAD